MKSEIKVYSHNFPNSYIAESYHTLQINLEYTSIDTKNKVIQFTSAIQGEAKSETASNMAVVSADRGKRTIIIDLDLRRPRLHRTFGITNENGITDFLSGKVSLDSTIKEVKENLFCITAGTRVPSVGKILESDKLCNLLKSLKDKYDYVFVDTPPITVAPDALIISRIVDGVAYVIASRKAKKDIILDAVNALKAVDANILGVVHSQIKRKDFAHYKYYKYKEE